MPVAVAHTNIEWVDNDAAAEDAAKGAIAMRSATANGFTHIAPVSSLGGFRTRAG